MQFDNISKEHNPYLDTVLNIVREGIRIEKPRLAIKDSENKKNQTLIDSFNIIGTQNPEMWIGVQKEHIGKNSNREDIYFYLNDDSRTRIFYIEAKRLPKVKTIDEEEYVKGVSTTGNPSGGIERFVLGIHGEPTAMRHYGMIGYIENKTIDDWLLKINESIIANYTGNNNSLAPIAPAEFVSTHFFNCRVQCQFKINHFWIDLTSNN